MIKIILFLLLLPAIGSYAQVKTLRFYHLSVENGLPKRTPVDAMQDKYGYIWAGTGAGLVRYDGYNAKVYLTNLGIGFLSEVTKIYEDHEGELWVGTAFKGLFQYDRPSDTFKQRIYFPSDSGANEIISIQEDGSKNIWAISYGLTGFFLNCFNKKTGKRQHFSYSDSGRNHIDATRFYSLAEDHAGHIWMSTNNGLYEYDSAANHFKSYMVSKKTGPHHIGEYIFYMPPSQPGIIWMNDYIMHDTDGNKKFYANGLIRFNTKDHTFTTYQHIAGDNSSVSSNQVLAALEDKENRLWIGTEKGISLFNRQTGTFTNYPIRTKRINNDFGWFNLIEDTAGNLWYSNLKGLMYFNTKDKTFTTCPANPRNPEALQSSDIMKLFTDQTGNLWVAEGSGGLQWINKTASLFTVYPKKDNRKNNYSYGQVNNYAEDTVGNIWLGTNKGLVYWNRHTNSFKHVKITYRDNNKAGHIISCIITDKRDMVWYGDSYYGLFRYNPLTGEFKKYIIGNTHLNANTIYEDREGTIWVGTFSKGLYSIDPQTGKVTHYPYIPGYSYIFHIPNKKELSSAEVLTIFEDRQGTLWIGTDRGLNRFNRKDSTFTIYINFPKGFTRIRTIREDKNGLLWIGTWEGGLFHFNPKTGTSQQFTEKNGLLFNAVYSCLEDSSGMLWLTSPRGITLFNPNSGATYPLDAASGLPVHIDYGGFKTREGDFLVTTSDGFTEFNPDKYHLDSNPPLVHIESLSFNKPQTGNNTSGDSTLLVFGHSQFNMRYNENRLTFRYLGLHYQNAAMTQYAYKLDGYDKRWIQAGTERSVTYTNLPPGNYNFQVKAANNDGVWSKKTASIAIVIHPPWWLRWWAYVIYIILGVSMLLSIRKFELNRKLKNARLRESQLRLEASEAKAKVIEAENARKTEELEEARKLQLSMLPKEIPSLPNLDIAVYMQTATEVGGDYYDFHTGTDGVLTIALGDATGHGLKAGTMVTAAKSLFSSYGKNDDIVSTFNEMSSSIKNMNLPLLTMCLTILKIKDHMMTLSSAGMPPVMIFMQNQKQVEEVVLAGMPLGAVKDFPYKKVDLKLESGDIILMMSDGFPELKNENEELLGYNRVKEYLSNTDGKSPEEIIEMLKEFGKDWQNGSEITDDITFIAMKIK